MPGIWDYLLPEEVAAGPRRLELADDGNGNPSTIHELRVPHAPLLSTDEPPLDDDLATFQFDEGKRFVWDKKTNRYEWEKA